MNLWFTPSNEDIQMKCQKCDADNPVKNKFCGVCGDKLVKLKTCFDCGHENPGEFQFCGECGK